MSDLHPSLDDSVAPPDAMEMPPETAGPGDGT